MLLIRCPPFKVQLQVRNNCGNSGVEGGGNVLPYHKGCCQGDKKFTVDYLSPIMKAVNQTADPHGKNSAKIRKLVSTKQEIIRHYYTALREESKFGKLFWKKFDVPFYSITVLLRTHVLSENEEYNVGKLFALSFIPCIFLMFC